MYIEGVSNNEAAYKPIVPTPNLPSRAEIDQGNLALQVSAQKLLASLLPSYVAEAEMSEDMDDRHKVVDRLIKLAGAEPSKKDIGGTGLTKLEVSIGLSGGSFNVEAKTEAPDVVDVEAREPAPVEDVEPPKAIEPYRPAPQVWDFSELDAMVKR